ncbi:hypothetical protein WJX84_006571 [Apatococcus fuscideae]|uniref:Transcription factor TFIIIC triple barrel domain-containing protein n=1 Tax=Apatococcus fuscideae TaxID=2026836 RepID=A0AAW1T115_9CHLO
MRESLACLILKASATASQEIFVECLQSYSQAVCSPQLASRPDAGEVVFREGEEEATYVVVDFQDLDKADQPKAGEPIKLEGLDSNQPKLTLVNGVAFTGSYEQTIGTDLLLSIHQQPNAPKSLSYLCHTENRLKFLRRELFLASPRCPVTRHNGEKGKLLFRAACRCS